MSSSSNKNSGAGGAGKRSKRAKKSDGIDPGSWECTVCTYRNRQEAFKCEMCDTRKGTSTRKPKLSSSVVEQHTIVQNFVLQQEQQHSQYQQAKHAARKNSAGKPQPSQSPLGTPSTPTPTRSTHSVESPSDNSFSSADHSPSTSKNPTPQPPPSPLQPVVSTPGGPSPLPAPSMPTVSSTEKLKPPRVTKTDPKPVHLRNIDKNSARSLAVTVNGTTVIITDYKLKKPSLNKVHSVKKSKSEQSEGNSFAEQTSSVKRTNGQNSRSEATPLALAAPFKKRKIGVQKDELTSVGSAGDPAERSQQVGNSNLQHAASPNTDMSSST